MTRLPGPDLAALVDLARHAAEVGARVHRDGLGRVQQVTAKASATDVVTEVDREAERRIVEVIRRARPDDALLGEEATRQAGTSGVRWIIDPLDGTTNYLYRYPAYSVSIGIEVDGVLVAGVVHDSARDRVYDGIVGDGARLDGRPIHVRPHDDLATALVATGFQPQPERRAWQARVLAHVLPRVRDVRRGGSAAIDLCGVASAQLDVFYEAGLAEWDLAAGTAIVRAAGGMVRVVPEATPIAPLVVAGNASLVDAVMRLLDGSDPSP